LRCTRYWRVGDGGAASWWEVQFASAPSIRQFPFGRGCSRESMAETVECSRTMTSGEKAIMALVSTYQLYPKDRFFLYGIDKECTAIKADCAAAISNGVAITMH